MDKNAWIALLLIGIVMISIPYWEKMTKPAPVAPPVVNTPVDTARAASSAPPKTPDATTMRADTLPLATPVAPALESIPWSKRKADATKGFTTIETPLYTAQLGWDGARFISWKLKKNGKYLKEDVELARNEGYSIVPGLVFRDGGVRTVENLQFVGSDSMITVANGQTKTLVLRGQFEPVGPVELYYTFKGGEFAFNVVAKFINTNNISLGDGGIWAQSPGMNPTEDNRATAISNMIQTGEEYFIGDHVWLGGIDKGEHEEFTPDAGKIEKFDASGMTLWTAQRSKYFVCALYPNRPGTAVHMASDVGIEPAMKTSRVELQVPPSGGTTQFETRVYWGPLRNSLVGNFAPNLDRVMNWGWAIIRPFSKSVLWIITFLYEVIPNYGLVILAFTILIKAVLWPLTAKQFRSMKEMQLIQPLLQEVRAKHKDNPKKMQEEMFRIYGEYKVNPAAGCVPMLLQMPILYSLFIVFRSTIELREAPFMLWITDLSQPEALFHLSFNIPLYGSNVALLPILMGVSQFFMGKQTASNDPNQKMMLYMMPIMMALLFNSLPSGLVLYYFFYNVATIVQQHYISGTTDKKIPPTAVAA